MNLNTYELSELISKQIREELSDREIQLLNDWINASADNKKLYERLVESERIRTSFDYFDSLDVDSSWRKAKRRRFNKRIKSLTPYIAYAATIAGIIFSILILSPDRNTGPSLAEPQVIVSRDLLPGSEKAILKLSNGESIKLDESFLSIAKQPGLDIFTDRGELNYSSSKLVKSTSGYNTLSVPKTGTFRIVLSDGTKVWLNSLTDLTFPDIFSDSVRKVYLEGEAYFEVAKDTSKPFVVEADERSVEVLGTHFNVNSYNSNWKTTLFEGSVKITNKNDSEFLNPGQEADIVGNKIIVRKADIKKAIAWKANEFYFKNESMKSILLEISRWYDLEIDDRALVENKRYSGSMGRDLKLSEVLKILNYLSGYKFHFDGDKLSVRN